MSASWWLRQGRAVADPVGLVAARVMLERDAGLRAARLRAAAGAAARRRERRKMRALVLGAGGRLAWRSVPAPPAPGPLAAVVHPIAAATCDLDRALALGATPFPVPLTFGHECVAEVLAVGSDVTGVRPGQRVVVPFQISCGACEPCRNGHTANCAGVPPLSMYGFGLVGGHWGGAVADELAVPFADAMLVPLPDRIDPVAAASVADNVSDGYRHIGPHLPALLEGGRDAGVLIIGALSDRHLFTASVSLYAGLVARALGAGEVAVADARASVREQAGALGLSALTPAEVRNHGVAPLVVDVSSSPAGLRLAIGLTAPDGVCTSTGALHASARLPIGLMFGRNVTVSIGRTHARAMIPAVLDLIGGGRLHPERVTSVVASLDDAPAALGEHVRGGATKTILTAAGG